MEESSHFSKKRNHKFILYLLPQLPQIMVLPEKVYMYHVMLCYVKH